MKRLLPLFLTLLACLSCSPPPFDLTLSQSAVTIKKLTKDNTGFITTSFSYGSDESGFIFYPQVLAAGFDYSAGFVASLSGLSLQIRSVALDPSSYQLTSYGQFSASIYNPDPRAPGSALWPAKGGSSYLFGTVFDALSPDASGFSLLFGDVSGKTLTTLDGGSLTIRLDSDVPGVSVLGSSVQALPAPGADALHWLARQTSGSDFVEATYLLGSGVVSFLTAQRGTVPWSLPFLPPDVTRVMYYFDEDSAGDSARLPNRSYASWYDTSSGAWKCATWWGTAAGDWKSLPDVTSRIDALLTNGDLLSTESEMGRIYDRDGNLLASFPMGSLVYLGEQYVGGVARTYFEQGYITNGLVQFNIYWIETDAITTLGG